MILEDLAPGARRRTHTAGTTDASLLGLLDDGNHRFKVQNGRSKVNEAIVWRKRDASPLQETARPAAGTAESPARRYWLKPTNLLSGPAVTETARIRKVPGPHFEFSPPAPQSLGLPKTLPGTGSLRIFPRSAIPPASPSASARQSRRSHR
jgi:hypothetical protein